MKGERRGKKTTRRMTEMRSHSAKQEAIDAIERLPDDVVLDEIVYRLYVLNKVRQGLEDIEAGRCVASEALAKEIKRW